MERTLAAQIARNTEQIREAVAWHDDAPDPQANATGRDRPLPTHVDWLVIGGGYAGLSAARRAAERGATVLLIERGTLRNGASSRNGGMVHVGFGASFGSLVARFGADGARAWLDLSRAAVRRVAQLAGTGSESLRAAVDIDVGWSPVGHLELARSARGAHSLHGEAELRRHLGLPVRLLDRSAAQRATGSDAFAGAIAVDEGGGVQPARLHAAMAAVAAQRGVDIRTGIAATKISREGGAWRVETRNGAIRARTIFAGVNGYADQALPALRRRAIPVASYMIATEQLPPEILSRVAGRGEMRFDTRNFLSYWRPTPDGRIAFGGRTTFRSQPLKAVARTLAARMCAVHPELTRARITHTWGGSLAFAVDRLPRVARLDGVLHVAGCAGSGIALLTHLAEQAVDWEFGGDAPLPASLAWRPLPIPYEGRPWFLPLAGLGFAIEDRWVER